MIATSPWVLRALRGCGALLLAALLAACGGGTEQIEPFEPRRMIALGDEASVLTKDAPQGRRYSVNALQSDGVTLDCTSRPIWHQRVASSYGFAYEECNPNNLAVTAAKIYAAPGAKVADIPAQLAAARLVNGEFGSTDLFTLLVGTNDVVDVFENIYLANPTSSGFNAGINELKLRGVRLAALVNELTRADVGDVNGPRIVLSTIPRIDQTPYGRNQAAAYPSLSVPNTLSQFSQAFNTALRAGDSANGFAGIVNDGRFIGLVELDAIINFGINDPQAYGLTNTLTPVCVVPLPDCYNNAASLVPGANPTQYLWAGDLWMGTEAHSRMGGFARSRAQDNPF
jgi:outer membrane lipase/esterase